MSAKSHRFWRSISLVMIFMMAFAPALSSGPAIAQGTQPNPKASSRLAPGSTPQQIAQKQVDSPEVALSKLQPSLRQRAQDANPASKDTLNVLVFAAPGTDLSSILTKVIPMVQYPDDPDQGFLGTLPVARLMKLASLPEVSAVIEGVNGLNGPVPAKPEEAPVQVKKSWAELRADADKVRQGMLPWSQAKAAGDGGALNQPQDWFEVTPAGPHKAQSAWARGYDGSGVLVAVNDDGVDWAHPDLMGRQKIYSSTVMSAYNGWPMAFSPFSLYLAALGASGIGYSSDQYVDTSAKPTLTPTGPGISRFTYTPLIDLATLGIQHTYVISNSMTKSGVIHVGTHPDESMRDYLWGEKAAVIVTDPHVAGVYDTVYVDLNDNYDFRDEKPLTRADTSSPAALAATKNNMLAYRDINGDGKADLSGGALYFIADGVNPIPASYVFFTGGITPSNGDMVAFDGPWASGYSHGTQCASNVVGQGVADGLLPKFRDLPGSGLPSGAVFGAAKNANVIDVSNIYYNFDISKLWAYTFEVWGYDNLRASNTNGTANPADTDTILIASNSYGSSDADNDGWDFDGRYMSRRVRLYNKFLSHLVSTGNGAPAYGTVTPPRGDVEIGVGASTQYGSTGWDSITDTAQINSNDISWYSNRGPTPRGGNGVEVVADGQRAAGDEALNYYSVSTWGAPDGNLSWATWGGTSRSAPAAAGNLALLYQAYKAKNGSWPTWDQARALLMSSATDLNYGTLTQGAGSVNADRGTAVAAGLYGLYVTPDQWNPGGYRGVDYPAFAHVMTGSQTVQKTFTIANPGQAPITASIETGTPTLIDSKTFTGSITPQMKAAASPFTFKVPQWIIPITATESQVNANNWWKNIEIPDGTQLMMITARYNYGQFDPGDKYAAQNHLQLMLYNWTDINGDHKVWTDKNGNGAVNSVNGTDVTIDGFVEPDWNNPATEMERWEYERFDYARPYGDVLQLPIHDPVARMKDGLFLGINQYAGSPVDQTDLTFKIDFYKYQPNSWLTVNDDSAVIPAGGAANFTLTATSTGLPAGMYEAAVKVIDPGYAFTTDLTAPGSGVSLHNPAFGPHTSVIPVVMTVAPDYQDGMTFGGAAQAAAQANLQYNNAVVRGFQDFSWRPESGDWRFFLFDKKTAPAPGTQLIVRNQWADAAPHTDLDTIIMGPTQDCWSNGKSCGSYANPAWASQAYYGPYTLATVGKSPNTNTSAGIWRFNTSTGGAEDWVTGVFTAGLHALAPHNVLFEGDKFEVPYTLTVGTIMSSLQAIDIYTYQDSGSQDVSVQSSLALPGLVADAYGLGAPQTFTWSLPAVGYNYYFTATHAAKIEITSSSPDISDIDIYLSKWDGTKWVQIASSAGGTANEHILVSKPADARYKLNVDNYSGNPGHAVVTVDIPQGADLHVSGTTTATLPANTPVTLKVSYNRPMEGGKTYSGLLLLGPSTAPAALSIPVTIHRLAASAGLVKTVNYPTAFAGDELVYTIGLINKVDASTAFTLTDPIPANTTYVTATMTGGAGLAFDAVGNKLTWSGTLPVSTVTPGAEGFEGGSVPPAGWSARHLGATTREWQVVDNITGNPSHVHSGTYAAWVNFDSSAASDEWLVSAPVTVTSSDKTVSFWAISDTGYPGATTTLYAIDASGTFTDTLWDQIADETWPTFSYRQVSKDLSSYVGKTIKLAWRYHGLDGESFGLDDVHLPGMVDMYTPSATIILKAKINAGVADGSFITNIAQLEAGHLVTGQASLFEVPALASARTHIGAADFSTSHKVADETAGLKDVIHYTVHVINSGDKSVQVTMDDPLPAHTTFDSINTAPPYNYFTYDGAANKVTWSGIVNPGEDWAFSFTVMTDMSFKFGQTMTNTAMITTGGVSSTVSAKTKIIAKHFVYTPAIHQFKP